MPKFEGPTTEQDFSPEERILELEAEIQELEAVKQEAVGSIKIESKKKKKKQKPDMQTIELPDNPETREVEFVKDDKGRFYFEYTDEQGNKVIASPGDLVADMQWGIFYDLNHEIKSSDHRSRYDKFRKQYLAAAYQAQIDKLETERLLIQRLKIDRVDLEDHYLGQVYQELYDELKQGGLEGKEQAGFVFEKMINGLLTKIAVDLGEHWHFAVAKANVIDDVELKTDLIVKFTGEKTKRGDRGVGTGENETVRGFQLTLISKNDKKWQRKKEQVQKVKEKIIKGEIADIDDLVLLETGVGNKEVMSRYDEWRKRGKFAGGPENLFSDIQIMQFLGKIFEGTDLDFKKNGKFEDAVEEYFEKYK